MLVLSRLGICKNPWLHVLFFSRLFYPGLTWCFVTWKELFFLKRFFILCRIVLFMADSLEVFCAINCSMYQSVKGNPNCGA